MKRVSLHLMALVIIALVAVSGLADLLSRGLADGRFGLIERHASGSIVVAEIDPSSIRSVGVWPWPREVHARLIDRLREAGAAEIFLDIDFSSPSTPASDQTLADALARAQGSVVLASFRQTITTHSGSSLQLNEPLPLFKAAAWPALVNVEVSPDGLVRGYSTTPGGELPLMSAMIAGVTPPRDGFRIDFSIRDATIPRVSVSDILDGRPETLATLAGRKVMVGATALELGDRLSVPPGRVVAGPVLQVLAAESLLQDRALQPLPGFVNWLLPVFAAVLMIFGQRRMAVMARILTLFALSIGGEVAACALQAYTPLIAGTGPLHLTVAVYLFWVALDEIDVRRLIGQAAETRFKHVAMSLGDGLICLDANGRINIWNTGALQLFGFTEEEAVGQTLAQLGLFFGNTNWGPSLEAMLASERLPDALIEINGQRKNGELFPVELSLFAWSGNDGRQTGLLARDITDRRRREEHLRYLAENDTLTGLPNRNTLIAALDTHSRKRGAEREPLGLMVIGIDTVQIVNSLSGQAFGDQLLKAIAETLKTLIPDARMIARLGDDCFGAIVTGPALETRMTGTAQLLLQWFTTTPLIIGTHKETIAPRIGIAFANEDRLTAEDLLGNAHMARAEASAPGAERWIVYRRAFRDALETRVSLEADLVRAVQAREFEMFYQPQIDLATGHLAGAEALIRWNHPQRGLVSPGLFMPIVNASTVSDDVAKWVLETSCRQARVWEERGHRVRIGINLSPSLVQSGQLVQTIVRILDSSRLSPDLLELEVTEDILLADDSQALDMFSQIRRLGARVVFDDFGTGFASLSYLKRFPLDGLKIDRSFVTDLTTNAGDAAIVSSITDLAAALGMSVIAEGIEDKPTADRLAALGVPEGQGYLFGKPMPASAFEAAFALGAERASGVSAA